MKRMKRIRSVVCMLLAAFLCVPTGAFAETITTPYTYSWDYFGWPKESPDAYKVSKVLIGEELGIGNFVAPQGLFVKDNDVFVCDTGNSRIVHLSYDETKNQFSLVKEFKSVKNESGGEDPLNGPKDIFVTEDDEYYICDTSNQRVLHTDSDLNTKNVITKPVDDSFQADAEFLPSKLVVDSAGRMYVQATNVNKGFMEYDNTGNFTGYIGASEVRFNPIDYIWKRISTAAQRKALASFVPTEYCSIALDSEGFIYATIDKFDDSKARAKPIRKLNATGKDILIRNGIGDSGYDSNTPAGDMYGEGAGIRGYSALIDVTVMENDTYYALDKRRGRVFGYDFQGNILYGFGGYGYKEGYFRSPTALDKMGTSLLILDDAMCSITLMSLTEYGTLINNALSEYKLSHYDKSSEYWQEVLKRNGNYDLAYIGIGRSLLREKKYQEAMKYFKAKMDYKNYSKAFKLYRKQWVEDNIEYIFGVIAVLVVFTYVRGGIRRMRKEVREA